MVADDWCMMSANQIEEPFWLDHGLGSSTMKSAEKGLVRHMFRQLTDAFFSGDVTEQDSRQLTKHLGLSNHLLMTYLGALICGSGSYRVSTC